MISVASDSVLVSDATFIMITIVAGKRDMKGLGMSHPYVSEDRSLHTTQARKRGVQPAIARARIT